LDLKLLINYLDINKIKNIRHFDKSYIENLDDKYFKFYFEWSNNKPKIIDFNLEGWSLIDKFRPKNDKLLCDLYIYRICQKN
jgi:hypothetical protein